ncbi:MAG: type II toxin-antitoxin system RelE/ParE family toxin [Planctomycetaceae bacterium]|nr:type II toxin-antitoxin system RelE/ParE family toxin [Planctomycetaceae bacterium]
MARIEKTSLAESDAIDIWLYISQDDSVAASRMLHKIEGRLQSLANMLLSAEAVPYIAPHVRRSSVGSYVIYYQPIEEGIQVIRILHGAREPRDLL